MQKPILFLYANSELSKKDLNKTTPFTIVKKKILRNKLNLGDERSVQDLCYKWQDFILF